MIKNNFDIEGLNTFRASCLVNEYFNFDNVEELENFTNEKFDICKPFLILGGGSNLLLADDFPGTVFHAISKKINETHISNSSKVIVKADAGIDWDEFVGYCTSKGYQGLENLTLIPGNVGAAPVQNIGAYGVEASELIHQVNCFDLKNKKQLSLMNHECEFTYRYSLFKQKPELIILSVEFTLEKKPFKSMFSKGFLCGVKGLLTQTSQFVTLSCKSIRLNSSTNWKLKMNFNHVRDLLSLQIIPAALKRKIVATIRTKTMPDPKKIGNVGCFFKSPIITQQVLDQVLTVDENVGFYKHTNNTFKLSAGDLIRSCKWNGRRVGDVSVESNRPLIILNHGLATGREILDFSKNIQNSVKEKFNISIEPEVVIIGDKV